MLRTTLATAWSHKRRLLGTALAIVLGVAFLSATLVLGDSARAGFATAFREANAGTDAYVRSAQELTAAEQQLRPPIDAGLVDEIAALDGVGTAVPTVDGTAQVLDADGDPIGGNGPPTMAAAWIDDPDLTGWELAAGRAPAAAGEVVVDRATAGDADVEPGDTLTLLLPERREATVVGTVAFGDDDSIGGSTYVGFTLPEAQRLLLDSTDRASGVVVAGDGVDGEQLVSRLAPVLPGGVEAITGDELTREQRDAIEGDFLGFLTTALTAFALVALLVAAFSIFNTFSILVAQRTRESALLRALGASRRQVLTSALVESALVGVAGAVAGAGAGILVAAGALALMESAGFGLPTDGLDVTGAALGISVLAGLAVTLVGGAVPAWRASRVAPLAALRDVAVDTTSRSRLRAALGGLGVAGGAALVLTGSETMTRAGAGAALVVVGMVLLGPVVARPVATLLGAPLRLRGISGDLARRNAVRNPRRTAATATALLVGVGVVSLFTVFGASVSRSIEDEVNRTFGGDLALTPAGQGFSGAGLGPGLVDEVRDLPEVRTVAGLGFGPATVDGRQQDVGHTDPEALAAVADFELVEGDVADVGRTEVAMAHDYATEHGHRVGDAVTVGFPDGATETVTVTATYEQRAMGGDNEVLIASDLWVDHATQPTYYMALVELAGGTDLGEGQAAVEAATSGAGAPEVMDREEFIEAQAAEVDALLTIIYALLAVAILIALMGIANTLSLSVHERIRELGLLRAVGQTRAQLRAMVRWESVVVATFGATGGLGLGLFLSWGLVRALHAAEGFGSYHVPLGPVLAVLAAGAASGILAGLRPAWRAGRIDVLDAIATE